MKNVLSIILFSSSIFARADAGNLSVERMCQAAASESSKFYGVMGELVAADPQGNPTNHARDLIQASYEKTKATKLQMPGAEQWFDTLQKWREVGVNAYLKNPNYSKSEYERLAYQICTKRDRF